MSFFTKACFQWKRVTLWIWSSPFHVSFYQKKKQLPRNYYKTTLYASLISNNKQVSVCVGVGGVGGCFWASKTY